MRSVLFISLIVLNAATIASAQSNKIVFGPLEGDDAGVLTVRNGEAIEIELWVRTDPENPEQIAAMAHGLMSEDVIIAERNGMDPEPEYDPNSNPNWDGFFVDGPFIYDPEDNFPISEGWTCEMQVAICGYVAPAECLDTQGEWDLYGTWLMVTNTEIPTEQTYYPFMRGWYPNSDCSTEWAFELPPGGTIVPEQDYCGLYFEPDTCIYFPGDVNRNGVPLELSDISAMIASYRGLVEPFYLCECSEDPPVFDFAATADPNGNCVANELGDVVTEIAAYRGSDTVSGCADCPGLDRLLPGDDGQPILVPSLKSKTKGKSE